MKIAVISDIHDNAHNIVLALEEISKTDVEQIYFLGDFVGAGISKILINSSIPVYAIWGNNDGDRVIITKFSLEEGSNMSVGFDTYDVVEIENRKIFLTHYPLIANTMAKSGDFDAVFYGHDHLKSKERIGECLVLNPGEIGAYKTGIGSYAIYDTETNDAEIFEIKNAITTNTPEAKKKFEEMKFKWSSQKSHKRV
jgi:putative phosphoesterase